MKTAPKAGAGVVPKGMSCRNEAAHPHGWMREEPAEPGSGGGSCCVCVSPTRKGSSRCVCPTTRAQIPAQNRLCEAVNLCSTSDLLQQHPPCQPHCLCPPGHKSPLLRLVLTVFAAQGHTERLR